jgi:uncharacterized RDD family membrane protein YckC
MSAQWVNARILRRGGGQYRLTIEDRPSNGEWEVAEEQSVCLEGTADRASLQAQLTELCEPYVSYSQAKNLLADLRGHVLGQTPTAIVERKYATILPRIAARISDGILLMPVALIGASLATRSSDIWSRVAWLAALQVAGLAYEILMLGIYGQTLGKMACGVIVRDISERPLSMMQAVLRNIVPLVLLSLGFWAYLPPMIHHQPPIDFAQQPLAARVLGYVSFIWGWADILTVFTNTKRRALHDYIAGSVVIRTEADTSFAASSR